MKVVNITYIEENQKVTRTALILKETNKTLKVITRNNELFGTIRTIRKSNLINISHLDYNDKIKFMNSCSNIKVYLP